MPASYVTLSAAEWRDKLDAMAERERPCVICPHACKVDRRHARGRCRAPEHPRISSANLHYGEEPPITGTNGSGTIFLTHCNLSCVFCQNFPISQLGNGRDLSEDELAANMLKLQARGAHNINFVSPMHYSAPILRAIKTASEQGLNVPIVWNSNAYESVETLRLLEGVVDIYLPDIKYSLDDPARRFSRAPHYYETAKAAVKEMQRQVGELSFDDDDIATRGLLIRHLVLPNDHSGTREVLRFIAEEISKETHISLMAQYFPAHRASATAGMDRQLSEDEYASAMEYLEEFGLENGWTQESAFRFC